MLKIDSIKEGIVIDHIRAGCGMKIYDYLKLDEADYTVALIKNVKSQRLGRKDLIKIENAIDFDIKVLGFIDPDITINLIKNHKIIDKINLQLPDEVVDVVKCKNPRCITSIEQEIENKFKLVDKEKGIYRCTYCDQAYES